MIFRFEKPGARFARPSVAGHGIVERLRAGGFALLGMTALFGLSLVALIAQQGAPLLPSLPLPALGEDAGGVAGAVRVDRPRVSGRVEAIAPAAGPSRSGGERGRHPQGAPPAEGAVPGPASDGVVVEQGASVPSAPDPSPVAEAPTPQAPSTPPTSQPAPPPDPPPPAATAVPTKPAPPGRGRGKGHGYGREHGAASHRPPSHVDSDRGRGDASAVPDRGHGRGEDRRDQGPPSRSR